jgi:hypothetical protein
MIRFLAGTPQLAGEGCGGRYSASAMDTTTKTLQAMVVSFNLLPGTLDIRAIKPMPPGPKKSMIGLEIFRLSMISGMFTTAHKSTPTAP